MRGDAARRWGRGFAPRELRERERGCVCGGGGG